MLNYYLSKNLQLLLPTDDLDIVRCPAICGATGRPYKEYSVLIPCPPAIEILPHGNAPWPPLSDYFIETEFNLDSGAKIWMQFVEEPRRRRKVFSYIFYPGPFDEIMGNWKSSGSLYASLKMGKTWLKYDEIAREKFNEKTK